MRSPWKLFSLLALLTLGLGFAACGDNTAASTATSNGAENNAAEKNAAEKNAAEKNAAGKNDAEDGGAAANLLADPTATTAGATGTSGKTGAKACDEACSQSGACSEKCKESGSSCCDKQKESEAPSAVCACAKGKAGEPVWCESCEKGYVDGKEVCCPSCVKDAQKKIKDGTQ